MFTDHIQNERSYSSLLYSLGSNSHHFQRSKTINHSPLASHLSSPKALSPSHSTSSLHFLQDEPIKKKPLSMQNSLLKYLQESKELASLQDNPGALLSTIQMFYAAEFTGEIEASHAALQYSKVTKTFKDNTPDSILLLGSEKDSGYSLIYLANSFKKIKPDFKIYGLVNTLGISTEEIEIIKYLVSLSGISQIHLTFSNKISEQLSSLRSQHHIDWVILQHTSSLRNMDYIRMMESLGAIQPGMVVFKINDFPKCEEFDDYLLGTPLYRRQYNDENKSWYNGSWNLVYTVLEGTDDGAYPVFAKCSDYLNS